MSTSELTEPVDGESAWLTGSARATWVRYQVLVMGCALAVITYIHRVGFAQASTHLKGPIGLSDQQIGDLMGAFMIAYGLSEVPWGLLADRFGVRSLLAIIALGGSLTTGGVVLIVVLPHNLALQFGVLLGLRFLFGMFQGGTFPSLSRMMADWMPTTERGLAQGLIWTSSRLGGALAPVGFVALLRVFGNWPAPVILAAAVGLCWCAWFWPWFRNRPEEKPSVNKAELALIAAGRTAKSAHGSGHGSVPWARMSGSLSVWSLCFMYGFLGYSGNFFLTMLPTYLSTHRHLNSHDTGVLSALPFAFGVVGCVLGGFLSDQIIKRTGSRRWGRRLVGAFGLSLGTVGIALVPWVQDTTLLALVLAVTFFGNDLAMGPAWAAAADIGERYAGTLGGAMNMLASFFGALGAMATGRMFDAHMLILPFVIFSASYAVGTLCWLGVDVTKTLADPDELA